MPRTKVVRTEAEQQEHELKKRQKHYESNKRYIARNREKVLQLARDAAKLRDANPEYKAKRLAAGRQRYKDNREVVLTRSKLYYANNKDRTRNNWVKRKYGITLEDYHRMMTEQKESCPICDRSFTTVAPHLDHNHKTNKARAILCQGCNVGIGSFLENTEALKKAVDYLNYHNSSDILSKES